MQDYVFTGGTFCIDGRPVAMMADRTMSGTFTLNQFRLPDKISFRLSNPSPLLDRFFNGMEATVEKHRRRLILREWRKERRKVMGKPRR